MSCLLSSNSIWILPSTGGASGSVAHVSTEQSGGAGEYWQRAAPATHSTGPGQTAGTLQI